MNTIPLLAAGLPHKVSGGLGLSNAWKAIRARGGEIHGRNMARTGCVFIIEVPFAADESVSDAVV
jgi:hypothetical protein